MEGYIKLSILKDTTKQMPSEYEMFNESIIRDDTNSYDPMKGHRHSDPHSQ